MRRLARHAFTLLSALSLLLCVAVCVLWVRSYFVSDVLDEADEWGTSEIRSQRGRIGYERFLWYGDDPPPAHRWAWSADSIGRPVPWPTAGFSFDRFEDWRQLIVLGLVLKTEDPSSPNPSSYTPLLVVIPHWVLVTICALLPARSAHRMWQRIRRTRMGECPACGYDLRAHAGGGPAMSLSNPRCPECAAGIAGSATQ